MKRTWERWLASGVLLCCAVLLLGGCTRQNGISHAGIAGMAGQAGKGYVRQEKVQPTRGKTDQTDPVIAQSFSYPIDAASWHYGRRAQKITGFAGRTGGIITTAADALALAKAECTKPYQQSEVAYDPQSDLWRVIFTNAAEDATNSGKGQIVYLYPNGVPMLVIVDNQ